MNVKALTSAVAIALTCSPLASAAEDEVNADQFQQIKDSQPVVLDPDFQVEEGIIFSGYARYGLHYSDDFQKYVQAEGELAGRATGRLGNETNGGEFQFAKAFQSDSGAIWDVVLMLENWWKYESELQSGEEISEYGDIALKKFYAGATNIFASQPNAYIWAGRDFHQRPQQGINDYFWMSHDGQGGGIYNLELGDMAKLDFSVVGQVDGPGDNGNYALTSKLHALQLADSLALSFLFNYGFESDQYDDNGVIENKDKINAYHLAAVLDQNWSKGRNQFIARYADNADTSVFNKTEDLTTLYLSLEGAVNFNEKVALEYLGAYHNYDANSSEDDRTNYSAIMRPMYNWNETHSTWLEAGYSVVDYDQGGKNKAWKVTLSQNVTINAFANARPMLRFYVTAGQADNQVRSNEAIAAEQDTLAMGAMFESWW
ncbi:carbohydrate porin [Agarivorans sp. Alg241-V36]|uniref:carbohydrate porin n=1 Tax=Agarivorans sp. Alg241-V36 TaxID=2305992 RepID=UPI0013D5EC7A|nr:carbohydrate porin [Agarivorans sp. Alg241-V36]